MSKTKIAVVDLLLSYPPRGGAGVDLFNVFSRLKDNYNIKLFGISFPEKSLQTQDFQRGIIEEKPPLNYSMIETSPEQGRDSIINSIFRAVSDWKPDLVYIADGWTLKPYLIKKMAEYFKVITRIYAYEMLCPRNNQKWLFDRKCDNNALKDCEKCLACALEYAKIVRKHRNRQDNPLTFEAALADIWKGDYCKCLGDAVRKSHFIVYNEATKKMFEAQGALSATKIPGGVNLNEFRPCPENKVPDNKFNILVFGRMDDKAKGAAVAIEAGCVLEKKNVPFKMTITSSKTHSHEWLAQIGWQSQEQIIKLLKNADCALVPSLWEEAFGMTWVEAAAMNVPVIASRIGGPGEYLKDGKTALLAKPGDAGDLAEKILALYNDTDLRKKLASNARKEIEEFYNWDIAAEMTEKLIEKVISGTADRKNSNKD